MFKKCLIIFFTGLILFSHAAYGAGIRIRLPQVDVDDIEIGESFSLEVDKGMLFSILNTGYEDVDVEVNVTGPKNLVQGFEPIPEFSWVQLLADKFTILGRGESSTDLIVRIPNDEKHRGKKYQADIWAYTTGGGITYGTRSNILIRIAE